MVQLQLIYSAVAGAALVGYVAAGGFNGRFAAVAAVTLLIFLAVGSAINRWLAARTPRGASEPAEVTALRALDLDEARRRALALLADPEKMRVVSGAARIPDGVGLPPAAREFFARYTRAQVEYGDLILDGGDLARSALHRGFVVIGSDTGHAEVLVRPGNDTVFIADPDEGDVAGFENYPSVYHLIVCNAALIYRDGS